MQTLGELIAMNRQKLNITQEELAFRICTGIRKIKMLEENRYIPSRQMLFRLSTILDIPLAELTDRCGKNGLH
jgi:Helix-turn-helix.